MILRRVFSPPVFADADRSILAHQLRVIVLTLIPVFTISMAVLSVLLPENVLRWWSLAAGMNVVFVGVLAMARHGRPREGAVIFVAVSWIALTYLAVTGGGVRAPPSMTYLMIVVVTGIVLGPRAGMLVGLASALAAIGLLVAELRGWLPPSRVEHTASTFCAIFIGLIGVFIVFQHLLGRVVARARRQRDEADAGRRESEHALRTSEERFRVLFDASNDGIFVHGMNPDGSPTRFTLVNDNACRMLGYTREELYRKAPPNVEAPDMRPHGRDVSQALSRDRRALFEMDIMARDGRRIPVEINSTLTQVGGEPTVVSVVRDVTERRRLEGQLRHAQKMQVIGQLAGGVAHDFNNLLVVILGNAELLLASSVVGGGYRELLEQIEDAGKRAGALTRQLLLFSRKQEPQAVRTDLATIVNGNANFLRRVLGEDVRLSIEHAEAGLPISADVNMIEQVLLNLAINARDAMPGGGTLTIRTRQADLDAPTAARFDCEPGRHAALDVSDTGCGMDEATRRRVFEPFFTTKPVGKGTGLGLSTVFAIVQQHRGAVDLSTRPGAGTEFTVYLPLANGFDVSGAGVAAMVPPGLSEAGSTRVLIVEDDPSVRRITDRILRAKGYRVVTADSPGEALRILDADAGAGIDIVLSDVVMPGGLNGAQLADEIARRRPRLPVVLMSGYARDVGPTDAPILQKPFTVSQLIDALNAAQARARARARS